MLDMGHALGYFCIRVLVIFFKKKEIALIVIMHLKIDN